MGNLTKLTGLYLGENLLSGEIPAEVGRLTNLRVMYLDGNEFALPDETLSEMSNLVNLEALGLASNRLSGEISSEFGKLNKLRAIEDCGAIKFHRRMIPSGTDAISPTWNCCNLAEIN